MARFKPGKLVLSFGKSSSANLPEARKLAGSFTGYSAKGSGRSEQYVVRLDLKPSTPQVLTNLSRLIEMVRNWKSTSIAIDGAKLESMWDFTGGLTQTCNCYHKRTNVPWADDYCCGKDAPTSDRTHFGCRLEQPVKCTLDRYSYQDCTEWFHYGRLSDDLALFYVVKSDIFAALRAQTSRAACALCPAFSWDRMRKGIKELPDQIDLKSDKRFIVRCSAFDSGKPIGIEFRERSFAVAIGFDQDDDAAEPQEREVPAVRYTDVAAQDDALAEIENVVGLPLKHPQYFEEVGIEPHRGVILYGSPGNGKTLIAKAVAGEADAHLEFINGPEILSKWVGESAANLRRVFERSRAFSPSVILIDEIDSIAANRDTLTHQHDISLISQLLVLLDGLEKRGRVAVVATTNRIEAVDPAVRRPGRFDYHIRVAKPDTDGREAILGVHLSGVKLTEGIILSALARETTGFSGADLAAMCREAGLLAIRRGLQEGLQPREVFVTRDDLIRAIRTMRGKRVTDASTRS